MDDTGNKPQHRWQRAVCEIIFESDTPGGKWFDILLIASVMLNVVVVMLDSVKAIHVEHRSLLYGLAWMFTVLFTVEYIVRLLCVCKSTDS